MARAMIDGARDEDGVRWARCPVCGDSVKNPRKAHMMIDLKGSTYCFHCGHSSQLGLSELIDLALDERSLDEILESTITDRGAKEQRRFSLLQTFEDEEVPEADAFEMRDQHGRRVGWHVRYPGKRFKNEGDRGIGYVAPLLKSKPYEPLVIVEGPYDVIKQNYVSVFGAITAGTLAKFFRLQYVWLFPDPDQVDSELKRWRFAEKVIKPALDAMVFIQGVLLAPGDPDEVRDEQIEWLTVDEVLAAWVPAAAEDYSPIHRALAGA